jgi:hypothetical protein
MRIVNRQKYFHRRDLERAEMDRSTHGRTLWLAFTECAVIFAMSAGQVYYLKRIFEQTQIV